MSALADAIENHSSIELKEMIKLIRREIKKGNTHITINGSWDSMVYVNIYNEKETKKERSAATPTKNILIKYEQRQMEKK